MRSTNSRRNRTGKTTTAGHGLAPGAIQPLEPRRLMSAAAVDPVVEPAVTAAAVSTTVAGYTPAQVTTAYGLKGVTFGTAKTAATGAGQTIAIVDAYNDPDIAADLKTFDAKFGLATASLSVVNQAGGTSLPATNAGWAEEISLDVEWAHAVAPGAKILLVETASSSTSDLLAGVTYARTVAGVSTVSMSWGTGEFSGETSYDSDFTTPAGHAGVAFVASAGDSGSGDGAEWPAAAGGVLSVGGTTLSATAAGTYESETGWADGGGGASRYEGEPTYQKAAQSTGYRTTPDVSYDANPNTGVAVYDSLSDGGTSGWLEFGGTSAGAPQWAALVALADQGRAAAGSAALAGATNLLPTLYSLYGSTYSTDFHDVTSGSTGRVSAGTGYDEVSGIGTPKGAALIAALVKSTTSTALSQATVTSAPPGGGPGHGRGNTRFAVELVPTVPAPSAADRATDAAAGTAAGVAALATPATFATGGLDAAAASDGRVVVAASSFDLAAPVAAGDTADGSTAADPAIAAAAVAGSAVTAAVADVGVAAAAGGLTADDWLSAGPVGRSVVAAVAESARALRPAAEAVVAGVAVAVLASAIDDRRREAVARTVAAAAAGPFADGRLIGLGLLRG